MPKPKLENYNFLKNFFLHLSYKIRYYNDFYPNKNSETSKFEASTQVLNLSLSVLSSPHMENHVVKNENVIDEIQKLGKSHYATQ